MSINSIEMVYLHEWFLPYKNFLLNINIQFYYKFFAYIFRKCIVFSKFFLLLYLYPYLQKYIQIEISLNLAILSKEHFLKFLLTSFLILQYLKDIALFNLMKKFKSFFNSLFFLKTLNYYFYYKNLRVEANGLPNSYSYLKNDGFSINKYIFLFYGECR